MSAREPLRSTTGIGAAVSAVLVLLVSFGLPISDAQQSAVLGVVAVLAPLVGLFARGRVTPVADPIGADGSRLISAAIPDGPVD